jgi:hypothetical protein
MVIDDIYLKAHSKSKPTAAAVNGLSHGWPQKLRALRISLPSRRRSKGPVIGESFK